jgi:hypothetical protein
MNRHSTVYDALQNRGLAPGQLVISTAGHDCGRIYLVLVADGPFVELVDGDHRPLQNPKRKRWRHVRPLGQLGPGWEAALDLLNDPGQQNALIRSLIANHAGWMQPETDIPASETVFTEMKAEEENP